MMGVSTNLGIKLNRTQLEHLAGDDFDMLRKLELLFSLFADVDSNTLTIGEISSILTTPIQPLTGTVSADTTYTLTGDEASEGMHQVFIPAAYLVASAGGPFTLTITTGSGTTVRVPIAAAGTGIVSGDLTFDIYVDASDNTDLKNWARPFNLGTVATTSGTSNELVGIPSWCKRLTVTLNGISTNGVNSIVFQLGTSAGYTVLGYLGSGSNVSGGGFSAQTYTTGLGIGGTHAAAHVNHGVFTLVNLGNNLWLWGGSKGLSDSANAGYAGSQITLADTLDRIRITTVGGADAFDAGSFTVLCE